MHTLDHLFEWVLNVSLRATALTVVVMSLQLLLRQHLSARWRYGLWLPVLVVLLLPVQPKSRWSVGSLLQRSDTPAVAAHANADMKSLPMNPGSDFSGIVTQGRISYMIPASQSWLAGALLLGLFGTVSTIASLRRVRRNSWNVEPSLLARIHAIAHSLRLRQVPQIWVSKEVRSPAVCGFLRPALLLNPGFMSALSREESEFVLNHELTHIRRGDLVVHAAMCLLMAVHWFNPILWLAFVRVRQDREAACDADVLRDATRELRAAYGHTLLKMETAFPETGMCLGFVGMIQRGDALRSRIRLIVTQPKTPSLMKAALVVTLMAMTFLGITRAAERGDGSEVLVKKLKTIIIPKLQLRDATVEEAVEFLRIKSRELDTAPPKEGKGVNFIVRSENAADAPKLSLDLANVPLGEALNYITQLATLKYEVKPFAIVIAATLPVSGAKFVSNPSPAAAPDRAGTGAKTTGANLVLDKIELRDAKVSEAVALIMSKSVEADRINKRGVKITLKAVPDTTKISLSLRDVPVMEAIRYVSSLAGCQIESNADSFTITPNGKP